MNNAVFEKTIENVGKQRNIKTFNNGKEKNYLLSEPNYHTTKFFTENLLAIEMRKTQILRNKLAYLSWSGLNNSKKILQKVYEDVAEDVETRCDTTSFELDRSLPKRQNKKVIGLMREELGGQIMKNTLFEKNKFDVDVRMIILHMKTEKNIIYIGKKFLTILTKY